MSMNNTGLETMQETAHRATYSPEDNKLRMYPDYRLDKDDYLRFKAAGFKWAPKQELFVAGRWTPGREDLLIEFCGEIGDEDTNLVERAEERADRFDEYSSKRMADAEAAKKAVDDIAGNIPFGQPILVGHHSERHARKHAEKIENGMRKAVKMWETSEYWERRAAGALHHAKYLERPDVRARRIKKIESQRRVLIASYTPKHPDQIVMQTPDSCPICGKMFGCDHPEAKIKTAHVWCGASRGGWWVQVKNLPAMEKRAQRWIAHYDNRLKYEKAMLGEQGRLDLIAKKKRPKQLPILNYREPEGITLQNPPYYAEKETHYPQVEMTKAEYKKIYSGGKGIRKVEGTHRVRICSSRHVPGFLDGLTGLDRLNKGSGSHCVFLTDSKVHKKPAPIEIKPVQQAPRPTMQPYTPPARTEFDDMKDSLKNGVTIVSAPQLFPTPPDLAERMINEAGIEPGNRVLEPSAGTGNLIDAIQAQGFNGNINLEIVELNLALADTLAHKYHKPIICGDFLEKTGFELGGPFDRIVMNPPFKNGEDIKHIKHALKFLKPGGRLVALCADGPRQKKELEPLADVWEPLPPGSFKAEGTNVNVTMLTIEN